MQKCGIFTPDNNILSLHIKRSLLLLLHNKSHLLQQTIVIGTGVYIINKTLHGQLGNEASLLMLKNICHTRHHAAI